MAPFAQRHPGANPLSCDGIRNKDGKIAVIGGNLCNPLAAKGHIEDVEFEHGALVEEPLVACQWSVVKNFGAQIAQPRRKNRPRIDATLPS